MRFNRIVPVLGAAIVFGAVSAQAQTCTTNPCTITNTASTTIGDLLQLTITGADPTLLTAPVVTDFNPAGTALKLNAGPQATVRSNRPWTVTVVGNTATFTGTGFAKSAADLHWRSATPAGPYNKNMSAASPLFSGNSTAGVSESIDYETEWHITTDSPGTYALVVNFTLSAP